MVIMAIERQEKFTDEIKWLGHSSFLVTLSGCHILTDPVFSDRCSPFSWLGPKRQLPVPVAVADLPQIDFVLISHNHYDHLDKYTVLEIKNRFPEAQFVVPSRLAKWFYKYDFVNVTELAWWAEWMFADFKVTAVPAKHFSGRYGFDRNYSHWCGFVVENLTNEKSFYFAGDTGYSKQFKRIGDRFDLDLALIPIGAYAPRRMMQNVHINPVEAVRVHQDVQTKRSIAMHWGTFRLTTEPINEPPLKLKSALNRFGIDESDFCVSY